MCGYNVMYASCFCQLCLVLYELCTVDASVGGLLRTDKQPIV